MDSLLCCPSGCHAISVAENVTDNLARGRFSPEGGVEVSHQVSMLHDTQNEVNCHPQHCEDQTSPEMAGVTLSVCGSLRGITSLSTTLSPPRRTQGCRWRKLPTDRRSRSGRTGFLICLTHTHSGKNSSQI